MKNKQSQAIVMLCLALIILMIGFIVYFLTNTQPPPLTGVNTGTPPVPVDTYDLSQYTDTDFGFTFWYPKSWKIFPTSIHDTASFPGGVLVKTLLVGPTGSVVIYIVTSNTNTITDEQNGHASPIAQTKYFYDYVSKQWMVAYPESADAGISSATTTANISNTTMSGLYMLPSGRRFDTNIIPLNPSTFVVVSSGGGNATILAKTVSLIGAEIEPTNLWAILQAEANAYNP